MKFFAVALFAAILSPAFGQITREELPIQSAFETLRLEPEIMLQLDGIDKIGPRTNVLYSFAFFKWNPADRSSLIKADVNDSLNGTKTHRIVADGTTLWGHDFTHNTYTSFKYGSYGGAQPAGFSTSMFEELTTASQGSTVFMARMLRELYSGNAAQYRTWAPLANVTIVSKTSTTTSLLDPVAANRQYDGDDFNFYVVYTYNARPKRSAAFHFSRKDLLDPWSLTEIYYADRQNLNASTPRLIDWKMTIFTAADLTALNPQGRYVYIPPTTARAIANVKGQGG